MQLAAVVRLMDDRCFAGRGMKLSQHVATCVGHSDSGCNVQHYKDVAAPCSEQPTRMASPPPRSATVLKLQQSLRLMKAYLAILASSTAVGALER